MGAPREHGVVLGFRFQSLYWVLFWVLLWVFHGLSYVYFAAVNVFFFNFFIYIYTTLLIKK